MTTERPSRPPEKPVSQPQLADRIRSIRDVKLRVDYLRGLLESMPADTVAELIALTLGPTELRRTPDAEFLLALTMVLGCTESLRKSVVGAAASRGLDEVIRFLGESGSRSRDSHRVTERPASRKRALEGERPLTLGERKALARKPDRRLVARAMRDPDPAVVAVVLENPSLTEDDVVRMCAARSATAATLTTIFRDPRWTVRYRVRRALVLNPACPRYVSVPLSIHLTEPDARLVAQSTELSNELRDACNRGRPQTLH